MALPLAFSGCNQPAGRFFTTATSQPTGASASATQPAENDWTAVPIPLEFDKQKAVLPLAKVPGDPPAPAAAGSTADAELPRQATQHIEEARRLFAEQRYSETVQELERALRYNANSHEARRMMALAYLLSGDDAHAKSSAQRALDIKPNDLAAHYVLGRVNEKAAQNDDALREYRLALKSETTGQPSPHRLLVNYYLGNLLYESGYYKAAIEQLTAFDAGLAGLDPKTAAEPELTSLARARRATTAIRIARAYSLTADHLKAANWLKAAVEASPKDNALRMEYVRALGRARRLDQAAAEAARLVAETNAGKESIELLMAVHSRAGHPERTVEVLGKLAAAQPDNIDLWKLYIDALSAAKRFDEAVTALNQLVTRHPDAVDSRWRLIQLSRERGRWSEWFAALVQHIQNSPDDARVEQELAGLPPAIARSLLAEIDRPAQERRLLPPEPADAKAVSTQDVLLACLAERLQQPPKACALREQALKRTPGFAPAMVGLMHPLIAAGQWQAALAIVQSAGQDINPPSARLELMQAQAHDGLDEIEAAVEHYKKAIQLDKTDVDAMFMLGGLYERTGRGLEAQPLYQTAIAAAPANMRARELFVRSLITQSAQEGKPNARITVEVKDMQRLAAKNPATLRAVALVELVSQGEAGRKACLDTLRAIVRSYPDDPRTREDFIGLLQMMRVYPEALEESKQLIARDPLSAEAAQLLAASHARLLDFAAAAARLDRALAVYPNRESLLARRAEVALIVQDYDAAAKAYRRLLDAKYTAPRETDYREALLETLREAGRFDEARQTIELWLKEAKNSTDVERLRRYLLSIDAAAGDHDRYVARVREWLAADPNNELLRTMLIGVDSEYAASSGLIRQGRYDEAVILGLTWLDEGLQIKPDARIGRARDLRLIGRILIALQAADRHAEAIELAHAQLNPGQDDNERNIANFLLRAVYMRAGKTDEAITLTEQLLAAEQQAGPDDARLLISLLAHAGRHEEAANRANKLIQALEEQQTRVQALGDTSTDPRRKQAVQRLLNDLSGRKANLLRSLSYVYQRMGRVDLAKSRLREAYKLDPTEIGINNDLGYLLADSNDNLEEAEKLVSSALAEQPRQAAYQDSFAWVLYKKGDFAGARAWLLRATAMDEGRDPVVFDHLADLSWRLGDKATAKRYWRKALELYTTQLGMNMAELEVDIADRVKAKLSAVESGSEPKIAPLPAETRPAG